MVATNVITQHLSIFRPTAMFGLGLVSAFAGGFTLLFFAT